MPRRGVRVVCTCDPGPEGQHASHCGYGPEDYAADMLRPIEPSDWVRAGELLDFLDIEHCDCPTPLHTMRCGDGGHVRVTGNRERNTR